MHLPKEFTERMQGLLKEEWNDLQGAWEGPLHQGLRVNTLKIPVEEFRRRAPFALEPVPWAKEGFYISPGDRPAKHPYYQAGLYYLQEPSAMAPAACLGIEPGDKVLDLCAAPGGKSTQAAALLRGKGLLVSNDNSAERVKALVWNLEHWGAANVVVTNEEPQRLGRVFPEYFDKILIDAPCSGEGMFRKDPRAARSWSEYNNTTCSLLQKEILDYGAAMLKPGGRLLYSTCTFSPEENESVIAAFLDNHTEYSLCELPGYNGWAVGQAQWVSPAVPPRLHRELAKTRRLWPHKVRGEGHFLALLEKKKVSALPAYEGNNEAEKLNDKKTAGGNKLLPELQLKLLPFFSFMEENLVRPLTGSFILQGRYVYRLSTGLPSLDGLKVLRPGWFVGIINNNRFEPSQALAMGLKPEDVTRSVSLSVDDDNVERYLRAETLLLEGPRGWTLVCLEEFPLGWAKQTGEHLKNYYPPGWRLLD